MYNYCKGQPDRTLIGDDTWCFKGRRDTRCLAVNGKNIAKRQKLDVYCYFQLNNNLHIFLTPFLELSASPENLNSCLEEHYPDGNQASLHKAVREADIDCVDILIDAGSEIDAYDSEGNSPLAIPLKRIRGENIEKDILIEKYCPVLKILFKRGAKFDVVKVHGTNLDRTRRKEELKIIFENCINGNIYTITFFLFIYTFKSLY